MIFHNAVIPQGLLWYSPFVRWQGALADMSSLDVAVDVTTRALAARRIEATSLAHIVYGSTIPQYESFYAAPSLAGRIGAPNITGPMISQACATSLAVLHSAAMTIEGGDAGPVLAVAADRTSNGPTVVYPSSSSSGGSPTVEQWVLHSFERDPWAGHSMLETAEFVAAEEHIEREELDEVTALRYAQYATALADDRAFQQRLMVPVEIRSGKKVTMVAEDQGILNTTAESLAKLKTVLPDGRITYGMQTHPADGAAGAIVMSEKAAASLNSGPYAKLLSIGFARVEKARMPKAPVAAARVAVADAGLTFDQINVVTSHNPFVVNDIYFARETGIPIERANPNGCSLIYGHPQGPTGLRAITDLVEALRLRGGGIGLFTGCAAGDTGGALVVRVDG